MNTNLQGLQAQLQDPATRDQALLQIADWWRNTVIMFGGEVSTAQVTAWLFAEGLAAEHEGRPRDLFVGK